MHIQKHKYFSANDLPKNIARETENGSPIKLKENELIEDATESKNIPYNTIFGKCAVFKAHEHDSLSELLQTRRKSSMAYVCRYKLVKENLGYRLEPVSWQPGDEERVHADEFSDFDEQNAHTDTDTQSESILDLNATIEQIHLNLTNDDTEQNPASSSQPPLPPQLVSPLRISNKNKVYKAKRTENNKVKSDNKRSSPDATLPNNDVSPSKRNKLNDNCKSYEMIESPMNRTGKYLSPAIDQMKKIKKNLNRSSFMTDTSMDIDMDETPSSPYVREYSEDNPMKMTLRKESKGPKTPLKERNDNTAADHESTKASDTPLNYAQHTIMKSTHRTRSK